MELAERVDIKIPIGENHYPRYEQPADIKYDRDEANFNRILDLYVTKKNEVLKQNGKEADFALSDGHPPRADERTGCCSSTSQRRV